MYRNSHNKDKTVLRPSYLYDVNSCIRLYPCTDTKPGCYLFIATYWTSNKMAEILKITLSHQFPWQEIVAFWFKCHWHLFQMPVSHCRVINGLASIGEKPLPNPVMTSFRHFSVNICTCVLITESRGLFRNLVGHLNVGSSEIWKLRVWQIK